MKTSPEIENDVPPKTAKVKAKEAETKLPVLQLVKRPRTRYCNRGMSKLTKLIDPSGGPDEEDPELHPDESCEFPPFGG